MLNIVLQDSTFKQLRDFIYEKSGIFIPDTKKYLIENRLAGRIHAANLKSFEDYLHLIRHTKDREELKRLFDAVTINETFFFREPKQLDVFADHIVSKVLEQKTGTKNIKIWCAACSTGEEPYTISMMLMEKRLDFKQVEIYASDISEEALGSAKKAVYNSYSVRNAPESYLTKYFSNSGQVYTLSPSVRHTVKFKNINLIDEKKVRLLKGMDVIFCRNVLIYFDEKAKQKVVSHLYDSLNPGGFLFIGTSESLHNVTRAFRPAIINKVIVYQKV